MSPPKALQVIDRPNHRSLHNTPRFRNGGLAILSSLLFGAIISQLVRLCAQANTAVASTSPRLWTQQNSVVAVGVLLIAWVSFLDDRRGVSPALRLGVQIVGACAVLVAGLRVESIPIPGGRALWLGAFAVPVTLLFLVWMSNLFNFMDGMDGLAAGMASWGLFVLGSMALARGSLELALLCMLTAAASGGFLLFNLPPARLFMGDVGSVTLGFVVAVLSLKSIDRGVCDFWVPVLVFSPFVVDSTVVVVRRLSRGARLAEAHREHAYQRLVLAGRSSRQTLAAEYCLMVVSGLGAAIYSRTGQTTQLAILVTGVAVYAGLLAGVRRVETLQSRTSRLLKK